MNTSHATNAISRLNDWQRQKPDDRSWEIRNSKFLPGGVGVLVKERLNGSVECNAAKFLTTEQMEAATFDVIDTMARAAVEDLKERVEELTRAARPGDYILDNS